MADTTDYQPAADGKAPGVPHPAPQKTPPSLRSCFKSIWIGLNGLRAGWSVMLFAVLVIVPWVFLGILVHRLHHARLASSAMTPGYTILFELIGVGMVLLATKLMSLFDGKSWLDYGLRAPHRAAHLGQGLLWGVVMMSAVMGALVLSHGVTLSVASTDLPGLLQAGGLWALAFALAAMNEEFMCRGYAFFTLASGTNATIAAVLMSALFGAAHIHSHAENLGGVLAAGLYGLVLCLAVWRTGSLWWALGVHAAWDWSESFVFGAADSGQMVSGHWLTTHAVGANWLTGGSAGPEGSVLMVPALLILALIVMLTLPRRAPRNTSPWLRRPPRST